MGIFRSQEKQANGSKAKSRPPAPVPTAASAAPVKEPTPPAKSKPPVESPIPRDPHGLLMPLQPDPPTASRQRSYISDDDASTMRLQIQLADMLRKKVLAPDLSLDMPLEPTDERLDKAISTLNQLIDSGRVDLPTTITKDQFFENILAETFGFGPLERFIESDEISEIMVNGPYVIFVEVKGKTVETGHKFLDDDHVERIVKRIATPLGRVADSENALVDARLPDGSRFNAVLRPVAIDGPSMSIRKFKKDRLSIKDLINFGSMTPAMATFLNALVVSRQNIVVSGGTGSGKTTLINCLSAFIPEHERTVTIEDAAELQFSQRNVVRLETKKPTPQAPAEITIRDCVRNALRMRPERIVVGECRGGETLDMLQAMNTGHDGSMTTVHSNNPRACISRLESLVLMAGEDFPISVVRKQIADSVNFIVQASRLRDGSRKVTHITEVAGMEGDTVVMNNIYTFVDVGDTPEGKIDGYHTASGMRPACEHTLRQYGFNLPAKIFFKTKR